LTVAPLDSSFRKLIYNQNLDSRIPLQPKIVSARIEKDIVKNSFRSI